MPQETPLQSQDANHPAEIAALIETAGGAGGVALAYRYAFVAMRG